MKHEYVAYCGPEFTIEWFFEKSGKSQAFEYYCGLSSSGRIKLLKLLKRMGDAGRISDKTKFMNEGDKIFAFKPQPDRFLCFFWEGKKIIITNAFHKKQQKLPKGEKERALKCRNLYMSALKKGEYYE